MKKWTFRHPFDFVPFPDTLVRQPWGGRPAGHERFQSNSISGAFCCTLTTITPLCLKARFENCYTKGLPPTLAASSLKGMLRNTLQMLGLGCGGQQFVYNRKALEQLRDGMIEPLDLGHMTPCTQDSACMVCRLFGYGVEKPQGAPNDREPFGWASKVRILESQPPSPWSTDLWTAVNDQSCSVDGRQPARPQDQGPRHKAFYYPNGGGKPAGWKIYRHATNVTEINQGHSSHACVRPQTHFAFRIEFENLAPEEFALLEFALTLTHTCSEHAGPQSVSLVHKLGYGKSVGLGSCRVRITTRETLPTRRYFGQGPANLPEQPCQLQALIASSPFQSFRDARQTPGSTNDGVLLLFPSYGEFRNWGNRSIADFDRYLAGLSLAVEEPLPPTQPASPPPPPLEDLPDSVKVKVTRIKDGQVRAETLDTFNGKLYSSTVAKNKILAATVEKETLLQVQVKPKSVNHKDRTFEGSKWTSAR